MYIFISFLSILHMKILYIFVFFTLLSIFITVPPIGYQAKYLRHY